MSVGAVVACCALAVACTPEPASAPSPTQVSTTPTESQIERQMRLDYEAAETAYRATSRSKIGWPMRVAFGEQRATLKSTADGVISRLSLRGICVAHQKVGLARRRGNTMILGVVANLDGRRTTSG